ncbi:cell wall hydrolase [Caulobacter sp. UC70_42]|uniref:cell wall hydrolase n=1 Tax=Caulobacter sp. UC70_42 TaxID=3374551 RepID=UPI0037566D63
MATAQVPANIAAALRDGPQTQSSLRRSQYLTNALQQMQEEGGKNIQSGGELAAKLLATAILSRQSKKADANAVTALKADQDSETAALIAALKPKAPAMQQPSAPQPQAQPAPQIPQLQPVALPNAEPAPPPVSQLALNPDVDKLVRTVWGEARGEDPLGQLGVANVVINRAKKGGKGIADVVLEPNQFEPWSNPKTRAQLEALTPDSADYQKILANIAPALQGQDVTNGADHFYSPTAQSAAGRAPPRWDNGSGVDHGRHRFFNLGYGGQGAHQRQSPAEMFQPQQPQQPPVNVATNGQIDPSMLQASAPVSPSGGGAPPAAPNAPPAAAAGGNPWPTYQPTEAEVGYIQGLLNDPRYHDQGVAEARKLQQKMTQPVEADIQTINGVPFYVSKTPGQGGQPVMIPIPQGAMTQVMSAQDAGLAYAQRGLNVQRDPLGNLKEAPGAPPQGYNAGPNGYEPVRGGPADPTRPQLPSAGYQYDNAGRQAPIQGGPADPRAPGNYIEQVGKLQQQVRPVVDQAIQLKRNIDAVRTGFQQQNGPGDIAMVNGLQKLIDEGVVREGDVALQLKAQGIEGGLAGAQAYLNSSGTFNPKIRQQILTTADRLYGSINNNYRDRVLGYQGMTNRLLGEGAFEDVFPSSVAQSLGWSQAPGQQTPQSARPPAPNPAVVATPGTREAAIAEARRRKLIP